MIFNVQHTANWEYIRQCKQNLIKKNSKHENAQCIPHTYHVGEKVMLHKGSENKYEQLYSVPHSILQVNTNGTVCLQLGAVPDTINIHLIDTSKEAPNFIHGGECNMRQSRRNR
jgi:hypothetical protein